MNARLHQAVALHRRGEIAAAGAIYEEILRAEPRQPDCLHLWASSPQSRGISRGRSN
jgi:hypothetical protein